MQFNTNLPAGSYRLDTSFLLSFLLFSSVAMKKEGVSPAGGGEGVVSICRYRMKAYKKDKKQEHGILHHGLAIATVWCVLSPFRHLILKRTHHPLHPRQRLAYAYIFLFR